MSLAVLIIFSLVSIKLFNLGSILGFGKPFTGIIDFKPNPNKAIETGFCNINSLASLASSVENSGSVDAFVPIYIFLAISGIAVNVLTNNSENSS